LKHSALTERIIGVFFDVYNELNSRHEAQLLNYPRKNSHKSRTTPILSGASPDYGTIRVYPS